MSKLFSPVVIKGVTLKNRIIVSPMCQYSSEDGFANDWHFVHLGSRAVGGSAMILTEATAISPEGRISPHDLGIWKDQHIEALTRITEFIKRQGSVPGIQLCHAGRKASTEVPWKGRGMVTIEEGGWQPVGPSPISSSSHYPPPREMTYTEIQQVIADFQESAKRALKAGFEVLEIHASHGYLLHQFLSPLSNLRNDAYGGAFQGRIRILLEVIQKVQDILPPTTPLSVRIPATDWAPGGWAADDAVELSRILVAKGVDLIDVTTGGLVGSQQIPVGPAYQTPFAGRIRRETGALTSTVGLITNAIQAESILVNGEADLVMLARGFLRNPYWPLDAAHQLNETIQWPEQYERAM
jgi:2,4-dienoyl-CoA reductase-like NADH-dependent reductase (Old Yellow Enzyme family)